ncbi:hypothetical protein Emed_002904 [Eimeria media]
MRKCSHSNPYLKTVNPAAAAVAAAASAALAVGAASAAAAILLLLLFCCALAAAAIPDAALAAVRARVLMLLLLLLLSLLFLLLLLLLLEYVAQSEVGTALVGDGVTASPTGQQQQQRQQQQQQQQQQTVAGRIGTAAEAAAEEAGLLQVSPQLPSPLLLFSGQLQQRLLPSPAAAKQIRSLMCDMTFVARTSDGLLLAESWSPHCSNSGSSLEQQQQQQQQQQHVKQQVKQVLQRLQGSPPQGAIDAGPRKFYYCLANGLSYLVVCGASYPRALAFCFLNDIKALFEEELKAAFGSRSVDYFAMIETIETPYFFLKFATTAAAAAAAATAAAATAAATATAATAAADLEVAQVEVAEQQEQEHRELASCNSRGCRIRRHCSSSSSSSSNSTSSSSSTNLSYVFDCADVGRKASDLKSASETFKGLAKSLSFRALLQQYAPLAFHTLQLQLALCCCSRLCCCSCTGAAASAATAASFAARDSSAARLALLLHAAAAFSLLLQLVAAEVSGAAAAAAESAAGAALY